MSALPDFAPSVVNVIWINEDSAAVAKCSVCRWSGKVHNIADQKGKRFDQREDKAYENAAHDGFWHDQNCNG